MAKTKGLTVEARKKEYPFCTPQNAQCSNCLEDNDIPTVKSTEDWRDCVLCLLAEIMLELKNKEEDEEA